VSTTHSERRFLKSFQTRQILLCRTGHLGAWRHAQTAAQQRVGWSARNLTQRPCRSPVRHTIGQSCALGCEGGGVEQGFDVRVGAKCKLRPRSDGTAAILLQDGDARASKCTPTEASSGGQSSDELDQSRARCCELWFAFTRLTHFFFRA
jgi:hypothetical protein